MICKNCGKKVYAKEVCECGEKAPNPHGKAVALNSVICTILIVLSVFSFITTASLRNIVNKNLLVETIEQVDLCSLEIKNDGKTVKLNQFIYDEFIGDERITVSNVDNILNAPFIKEFIIEKIEGYQDFFMDRGDMVFITSDDIVNLIDENSALLYKEAGLNFLGPDKEALKNDLEALDTLSEFCNDYLTGWFTGNLIKTYFSLFFLNFLEILFIVILIQWLVVYRFNGRKMSAALKKYSIALIVPSAIVFISSVSLLFFSKKSIIGALTANVRMSFILSSEILLAIGIVLLSVSIILNKKKASAPAIQKSNDKTITSSDDTPEEVVINNESSASANTTDEDKENIPDDTFAPENTQIADEINNNNNNDIKISENTNTSDSITSETAEKKVFCTKCGAENKPNSKFCSKCGEKII